MADFTGFSNETILFLSDLKSNNSKIWFDDNRHRYEAHYLNPAKDFVTAIGPALQSRTPGINAEPRVNGSIFRVNRDIRFSKDKTPYKPHIDLWFWEGERKIASSGLFFRLAEDRLILGAGAHGFPPDTLRKYRTAIVGAAGSELAQVERVLVSDGLELSGLHYKKQPRGFDTNDEVKARLLRHNALYAGIEIQHPANLSNPTFVDFCLEEFKRVQPVHNWLRKNL